MRFELTTSTLARLRSTPELRPHKNFNFTNIRIKRSIEFYLSNFASLSRFSTTSSQTFKLFCLKNFIFGNHKLSDLFVFECQHQSVNAANKTQVFFPKEPEKLAVKLPIDTTKSQLEIKAASPSISLV